MKKLVERFNSFIGNGGKIFSWRGREISRELILSGYSFSDDACECSKPLRRDLKRKQAGILYADIADYARLTEQDEEGTHRRLVEAIRTMMTHVTANGGRIAHLAGDAILAEFADADGALHCAINVQLAARHWNIGLAAADHVKFRIGVNFGDVISDQGDIYGNAVNLAARLEQLASSGGVCVSESVMEALDDNPSFNFVAMGKQYVKNISEPVRVFWIEIDSRRVVEPDRSSAVKVSALTS